MPAYSPVEDFTCIDRSLLSFCKRIHSIWEFWAQTVFLGLLKLKIYAWFDTKVDFHIFLRLAIRTFTCTYIKPFHFWIFRFRVKNYKPLVHSTLIQLNESGLQSDVSYAERVCDLEHYFINSEFFQNLTVVSEDNMY